MLSSIEWAHIPQVRGGAQVGLSSVLGAIWGGQVVVEVVGGRENELGMNQHQPLMWLMFNSNSAPR